MASPTEHDSVKNRAAELKERNRGSCQNWLFSGYDDKQYESPRPKQRINTNEAREYSDRNQGSLREVMSMTPEPNDIVESPRHKATPRKTGPPVQRCPTEESRRNMDRHGGQGVKDVFGGVQNGAAANGGPKASDGSPTKSRTRPEGQANADKNKGSMSMSFGGGEDGSGTNRTRVKPEASRYAERNKGSLTQQMKSYGDGQRTPPPVRRVKPEAQANAGRSGGTGIMDVFHHQNTD